MKQEVACDCNLCGMQEREIRGREAMPGGHAEQSTWKSRRRFRSNGKEAVLGWISWKIHDA